MSTPPELGLTGAQLHERTLPVAFADAENGYAWAKYLAALSLILDPIARMVYIDAEGNPGWSDLASPSRCPREWLPVLAQWAGVRRPDAMSEDELRELIGPRAPGMWRGTRAAMIAAIRRFYDPGVDVDRFVYFEERADGDPYRLRIFTYSFIPHDAELVADAIAHATPAGLRVTYEVRDGQTYNMLRDRHVDYNEVRASYDSYNDVRSGRPTGVMRDE